MMVELPHDPDAHERLAARLEAEGYRVLRDEPAAAAWTYRQFADWYRARTVAERSQIYAFMTYDYMVNWALRRAGASPDDPLIPRRALPYQLDDPAIRAYVDMIDHLMTQAAAPERLAITRLFNMRGLTSVSAQWSARMERLHPGAVLRDPAYLSCSLRWDWGVDPSRAGLIWGTEPRPHHLPQHHAVILLEAGAPLLPVWSWYDLADYPRNGQVWVEVLLPRGLALRVLERPGPENNHRWIFCPVGGQSQPEAAEALARATAEHATRAEGAAQKRAQLLGHPIT